MTQTYRINLTAGSIAVLGELIDNQLDFMTDMLRDTGPRDEGYDEMMIGLLKLEAARACISEQVENHVYAMTQDLKGPNLGRDLRQKIDDIQFMTRAVHSFKERER